MSAGPRVRTALIASAVMAAVVVLLSAVTHSFVLASFSELEDHNATQNLDRVGSALQNRLSVLSQVSRDWGAWDDTYEFVRTRSAAYIKANLTPDTLANLGLRYLIYFDAERTVVHAVGADVETVEAIQVAPGLLESIAEAEGLFALPHLDSTRSGIVQTPDGLMMVAAAPITDSSFEKEARGTFVVAALLDESAVQAIAEQTKLDVSLIGARQAAIRRPEAVSSPTTTHGGTTVMALDDRRMRATQPVLDVAGDEVAAFQVDMRRDIWRQGVAVARWLTGFIGVFGLVSVAVVIGLVDRRALASSRVALEHAVEERTSELVTSEARFRDLVDHMAQGLIALDEQGQITFANREAERLFGVGAVELEGRRAGDLFIESDVERHLVGDEARTASVNASVDRYGVPLPVEIVATGSGEGASGQWLVRDVTIQRRYEQQLVHLASHDHLTGLVNRRRFEEELAREVAAAERGGRSGGILWLDLDHFKEVNDTLGHRAGDELLVGFSGFLLSSTRTSGVVARIGGDEFAVLVPDATVGEIQATAERLITEMAAQRFEISDHRFAVTASIGVAVYPDHGTTVEELLSHADIAMYTAKERGAGTWAAWSADASGDESNRTRLEWSERIRTAVDSDTIVVYAQPIADSATGRVSSHELLMRLPGDEPGRLIMPNDFLPAAERLGLIRDLDRWMALNAIRLIAEHPGLGTLHVNLSGRAFSDTDLLGAIEQEFSRTGADPTRIGFEITETAAIADINAARELIGGLRRLGCSLSLDDFGSGFSSFYYLRNLPIDCLKIDGAFVTQLKTSEEDRHLVRAIVELAKALGLDTVAEYVEDEQTLSIIRDMGVTFAQGYHVGRPIPLDRILDDPRS